MPNVNTIAAAFNKEGQVIGKAAAAIQAAREATNKVIQYANDELTIAWATSNVPKAKYWGKPSGEVRKQVKAMMELGVASGAYQADMAETMVHCFGVAFIAGIPFTRDLKRTHKADGTPREEKREAAEGAENTGGVTTTTPEAAEKTARKLIAQLRMLQADTAAAAIVDAMLEFNPAFTEIDDKK
ncbi:hypothetical protein UFOVP48_2 [uncultured Caudovirales phage]|uniref:Uncharacterized protein n=1 Tax=uncultured Caudovirales phage TaxID=2100421 RepID=A0A6J5KMB7_9CAUD|nr:hypothetical protein UFOVP48_2 [uncultured Caudovirales phage]